MKTSANGLAIIKAFEGCHRAVKGRPGYFKAYIDPVGVLTIGHGHTNHHPPKFDAATVWSQAECDRVLASDLGTFERHVEANAKVPLKQHEFDALVSWAFNTGGPATASVWRFLNAGEKEIVPAKLALWNKGGGRVLPGLTRRRKAEGLLWQGRLAEAFSVAGVRAPGADYELERETPPPPDVEPIEAPEPAKPSLLKRIRNWIGGLGVGTSGIGLLGYLTDPWVVAILVVAVFAAVALTVWFIGPSRVRSWIHREAA